jgi:hypothetical protein
VADYPAIVWGVSSNDMRAAIDLTGMTKRQMLVELVERMEDQMAAIDDLRAAVQGVQDASASEHAELGAVVDQLGTVTSQLSDLQATVAAGGGVTEADLEGVATTLTGIAQSAQTAVQAAKDATTPGGVTPPAGTTTPAEAAGAPGAAGGGDAGGQINPIDPGTAAPMGSTDPAPVAAPQGATPADPTGAAPVGGSALDPSASAPTGMQVDDRTRYVSPGDASQLDPTTWPSAPVQTTEDAPRQLYYFAGDTEVGQQNGAGVAGMEVWEGETQPTVAAGAADEGAGPPESQVGQDAEGGSGNEPPAQPGMAEGQAGGEA